MTKGQSILTSCDRDTETEMLRETVERRSLLLDKTTVYRAGKMIDVLKNLFFESFNHHKIFHSLFPNIIEALQ